MTRSHCCLRLTRGQPCLGGSAAIACSTRRGSVGAVPLSQAPLLSEAREVDSAGPNRQLVGLIRSRDPDVLPRRKHNRNPSGGAPCNPVKKIPRRTPSEVAVSALAPERATSTDFSLSATPFHFFSPRSERTYTLRTWRNRKDVFTLDLVSTRTNASHGAATTAPCVWWPGQPHGAHDQPRGRHAGPLGARVEVVPAADQGA